MARTINKERAVDVGATGTRPASKAALVILIVSVLAAIWAVAMMTSPGRVGYVYFFMYAEYYMGVISLVSLSITIMLGLVATDRLVLSIRQRVLLQSAHRTTGLIAVTALVVHVWTKIAESHIRLIDAFIPFISPSNTVYVGLGTLSGWIMLLVMWTGIARARFIGRGQPWMWRSIHAVSYLMWPIALVHGLAAGRAAHTWVTVSYVLCILMVLVGLAVRLSVSLNRRKDFASSAGVSGMKPVGKMVPTTSPAVKKRWEEPQPVAVVESWRPAGEQPADTHIVSRRAIQERLDEDEQPRGRRRAEAEDDLGYEPRRAARRVEMDDSRGNQRPAAPRQRRYEDEEQPSRHERYDEDRGPRYANRRRRDDGYGGEPQEAPRPRRDRGADDERAGSGRHSVAYGEPGDEAYLPPDDTPTLVDMASRRARREERTRAAGEQQYRYTPRREAK